MIILKVMSISYLYMYYNSPGYILIYLLITIYKYIHIRQFLIKSFILFLLDFKLALIISFSNRAMLDVL